jgi:hypothetical protein
MNKTIYLYALLFIVDISIKTILSVFINIVLDYQHLQSSSTTPFNSENTSCFINKPESPHALNVQTIHKMSRQSRSSKHSHHSKSGGSSSIDNEDVIEQVKSIVTLLYEVVSSRPDECETYIPSARSAMSALDQIHFFRDPQRFAEQVWILNGLQQFTFYDADAGCIRDVTEFCQASWLRILRNFPDNVEVLSGKECYTTSTLTRNIANTL